MTDQRARIERYVAENPGVLQGALGFATGQAQYHRHRLVRRGALDA